MIFIEIKRYRAFKRVLRHLSLNKDLFYERERMLAAAAPPKEKFEGCFNSLQFYPCIFYTQAVLTIEVENI